MAPDGFRALLSADLAESVRKRLAMFVLRSKGDNNRRYGDHRRVTASADPLPRCPAGRTRGTPVDVCGDATGCGDRCSAFRGPRYLILAPADRGAATLEALARSAQPAGYDAWQWLTIHAGVPVITAPTQDKFVPQTVNWDVLGGINFRRGCYTGRRSSRRTQYLGRLKERLYTFAAAITAMRRAIACTVPNSASSRAVRRQRGAGTARRIRASRGGADCAAANADVH
jgi:folate-binding protein YgfZ